MRDTLLALLEDGPKDVGQLAGWLGCSSTPAVVIAELNRLQRADLVKRVGVARRWALMAYVTPEERAQDDETDDDVEDDKPKALRLTPPHSTGHSWWVGLHTYEEFSRAARERDQQMQHNRAWRMTSNVNFSRAN